MQVAARIGGVTSGCGKDRKGTEGVLKNKGLQLIVF